ncbi:MAG: cyclic pyranopterin monophosphate synthase MoaC [Planctomycetota bacterium]|nr:MAG: cyclic pyranopterin monophosphate synthase MoaC [Planctomycetota bacterium]
MDGDGQQSRLSHFDDAGAARMVDVGGKPVSRREAVAEAFVRCSGALVEAIRARSLAKGDLACAARIAGTLAAKRVDELIPLCHPLPLDEAQLDVEVQDQGVLLRARVCATARTGVEMEALTAATVAALTVVDMGKAVDRGMVIERVRLLRKTGGTRGEYTAPDLSDADGP